MHALICSLGTREFLVIRGDHWIPLDQIQRISGHPDEPIVWIYLQGSPDL